MATLSYRIVVLGAGGVGKSALTLRLISDEFAQEYDPTIEDSYRKQVTIDSEPALLDVLDTAGQEEYASLQDQWIREGDGYLVVYAINSMSTFEESKVIREKIRRICEGVSDLDTVPMIFCGNKCDLENERRVTKVQAQSQADEWDCPFYEASAKTKKNAEVVFYEVVRRVRTLKKSSKGLSGGRKKGGLCTLL